MADPTGLRQGSLQPRTSCRAVVRQVQAFCETEHRQFDESTSAYCQARSRPPINCLHQALTDSAAAAITVRIIHVRIQQKGFRTQELWISTMLLDPIAYPAEQIAALYLRRWEMELCFRDLKTTMGMEDLRCRSPALVQKELLVFLVAHNFIRCLIAQAASAYQVCRTRISFKGAVDAARSFHQAMRMARSQRHANRLARRLLEILARDLVAVRPGRYEPRALKRRPKPYARLTKPRHCFREAPHRGKQIQMKPGRKPCLS